MCTVDVFVGDDDFVFDRCRERIHQSS
jgi:hypothetical protein